MEGAGAPKIPEADTRQQDRASLAIIVITLDPEVYWRADAFRLIGLALNPPFVHSACPNITVNTLTVGKASELTVLQFMLHRLSSSGQDKQIYLGYQYVNTCCYQAGIFVVCCVMLRSRR